MAPCGALNIKNGRAFYASAPRNAAPGYPLRVFACLLGYVVSVSAPVVAGGRELRGRVLAPAESEGRQYSITGGFRQADDQQEDP